MSTTKKYSNFAAASLRKFFRPEGPGKQRWKLSVGRKGVPLGTDWKVESRYGSVESAVVPDKNGEPLFDRPISREVPNVNILAWGRASDGEIRIGLIRQERPHADDPCSTTEKSHAPLVFGQVPMGFVDPGETPEQAAFRETREETGSEVILSIERPPVPFHNPNPSHIASWSDLVFVQVDLEAVGKLRRCSDEPIISAEYVPVSEVIRRIAAGRDSFGAYYRACTSNSLILIFLCVHPEFWPAQLKQL